MLFVKYTRSYSDAIDGLLYSNPSLRRIDGQNVIVRADIQAYKQTHVTIISGGGSGHEPAHAGFIGDGCLSAAVLGNVFASPSVSTILSAIRVCGGPRGVLLVVKNYTGDRLNFGMAMERAKSAGINCKMVIVEDDCALPEGKGITGGRGVAGTVFVHKISGAYAAQGFSLDEVYDKALYASKRIGSMGVALTTCTVPGAPVSTRLASPDIIELGMGIHGEPGREQLSLPNEDAAKFIAGKLVDGIIGGASPRLLVRPVQKVAILINNLGGLPVIEMLCMCKEIIEDLKSRTLLVSRLYIGPFMTSLEMSGLSLSILSLEDDLRSEDEDSLLGLLDARTTATAWTPSHDVSAYTSARIEYNESEDLETVTGGPACPEALELVRVVCNRIIDIEPMLTQYDSICGDGDCGLVMKAGAKQILLDFFEQPILRPGETISETERARNDSAFLCNMLANSISRAMGGTSGALLELFFRAAASYLSTQGMANLAAGEDYWSQALKAGVQAMTFYGGATTGMRTMLDALIPAVEKLAEGQPISVASVAAVQGMESTKFMESLAGRSNYVLKSKMEGTPDPGAVAVAEAFKCAATIFQK